jgi:hypothetical protein
VGEGEIGGLGVHPGLRHRDGGLGAAGAERISGRRKSHPEGPVERAWRALAWTYQRSLVKGKDNAGRFSELQPAIPRRELGEKFKTP